MTEKITGGLADFAADDVARAGGKGANLGELVRHGFSVPPGVVLTTSAYAALLADTGLGRRLDRLLESGSDGSTIRDEFARTAMPERIRAEISAAYASLGAGPVAVRSSGTAEDLAGAAFAGQHDTYLNVLGEDAVLAAVTDCWASLWTDRAMA